MFSTVSLPTFMGSSGRWSMQGRVSEDMGVGEGGGTPQCVPGLRHHARLPLKHSPRYLTRISEVPAA